MASRKAKDQRQLTLTLDGDLAVNDTGCSLLERYAAGELPDPQSATAEDPPYDEWTSCTGRLH